MSLETGTAPVPEEETKVELNDLAEDLAREEAIVDEAARQLEKDLRSKRNSSESEV